MKLQHFYAILLLAMCIAPVAAFTQPPPPPPPIDTKAVPIPFDGGISLILLAAGAGYAVKKHRSRTKQQENKSHWK